MVIEKFEANINLDHQPKTGKEAYSMLVQSLINEIWEKMEILSALEQEEIKKWFIDIWDPSTKSIHIDMR